jgi:hypothetical protein
MEVISDSAMDNALYDYIVSIVDANFDSSRRLDLHALGVPSADLSALVDLFIEDEVWSVIFYLPNDKAPGPDCLTDIFYKRSWGIIRLDIMNAFNAFWSLDSRSFNHLNDAYMFLLRKKEHPVEIRDYRPISLIHSFGKLITKCLAKRLAGVLDGLVLRNQSAFIKGRCIHDNFSRSSLLAKRSMPDGRRPSCSRSTWLRLTVSWPFLLEVLRHMGFGQCWTNWISTILSTASTKILLNGQLGRRIYHARGLCQGDPLSPCSLS